jgi:hypothetical protein
MMAVITGKYILVPNPCTTLPCLPGMVYAVLANNEYYYVTINQSLLWMEYEQRSWDGYTPKDGDHVTIVGKIQKKQDIKGETFYQIEIEQLKKSRKGK